MVFVVWVVMGMLVFGWYGWNGVVEVWVVVFIGRLKLCLVSNCFLVCLFRGK